MEDIITLINNKANANDNNFIFTKVVLDSITAILKQKGIPPSPTAYFAALISSSKDLNAKGKVQGITPAVHLLSLILKKLQPNVLRKKFDETLEFLFAFAETKTQHQDLMTHLTVCLFPILDAVDNSVLKSNKLLSAINLLVSLATNSGLFIRKESISTLHKILTTTKFPAFVKLISEGIKDYSSKLFKWSNSKEISTLLLFLSLLQKILPHLQPNSILSICTELFHALSSGQTYVINGSFRTVISLFTSKSNLSVEKTLQIIEALLDVSPNEEDVGPLVVYFETLTHAFKYLAKNAPLLNLEHLPKVFSQILPHLASSKSEIVHYAEDAIKELITECITDEMINEGVASVKGNLLNRKITSVEQIILILEGGFKYMFKREWNRVLSIATSLFKRLGRDSHPLLLKMVITIDELNQTLEAQSEVKFREAVYTTIGHAIHNAGVEQVLTVLPLNFAEDSEENTPRTWLLPLLRQYTIYSSLNYYTKTLLPIANEFANRLGKTSLNEIVPPSDSTTDRQNTYLVYKQIWDAFPSFCNLPLDVPQIFPSIARTLGNMITDDKLLRPRICFGLRTLIEKNKEFAEKSEEIIDKSPNLSKVYSVQMANDSIKVIAEFSRNFLPILFNVYVEVTDPEIQSIILQTVDSFVSISPAPLVNTFFKNVVKKLLEETIETNDKMEVNDESKGKENSQKSTSLIDLVYVFVEFLDEGEIEFLYQVIKPFFKGKQPTLQKKSYKILSSITKYHHTFTTKNLNDIYSLMTKSLDKCNISSKRLRLQCLSDLLQSFKENKKTMKNVKDNIIPSVLADVIICCKESSAKCREMAYSIVTDMAQTMIEMSEEENKGLQEYMTLVLAGLGGTTPRMISASIVALSLLISKFKENLDENYMRQLSEVVLLLIKSQSKEIVKSCLGFFKIILKTHPSIAKGYVEIFLKSIEAWDLKMNNEFRGSVGFLLIKIARKCGEEILLQHIPEHLKRPYLNLKKEQLKKIKAAKEGKSQTKNESDDETIDDVDLEEDEENELFIKDDDEVEDDPIDLLDRAVNKKITSTNPNKKPQESKKESEESEFIREDNNKLIIEDPEKRSRTRISKVGSIEKILKDNNLLDSNNEIVGLTSKKSLKRQLKRDDDFSEDDEPEKAPKIEKQNIGFNKNYLNATKLRKKKKVQAAPNPPKKHSGKLYKGAKASGDILKGKIEPYAYFSLNPKNLNKRNRSRTVGQFNSIVTHAKKGATAKVVFKRNRKHS